MKSFEHLLNEIENRVVRTCKYEKGKIILKRTIWEKDKEKEEVNAEKSKQW